MRDVIYMELCSSYQEELYKVYDSTSFDDPMNPCTRSIKVGFCNGTRERERCSCKGNRLDCDFYQEVKEKAQKETTEYKIKEAINLLKNNGYVIYKEV